MGCDRYNTDPYMSERSVVSVDVVIPLYNGASFIREAIGSVMNGNVLPERIIVVDDGSTDNGPSLVEGMIAEGTPVPIVLLRQANGGPNAARENGRRHGNSTFIAFLDADDVWEPGKLEAQVALLQSGNAGLVYCAYHLMDERGVQLMDARVVAPTLRGRVFDELLKENLISGSASAVLIRRGILDQAGSFDTDLQGSEDLDMWLRIARIAEVDFVDQDLLGVRQHASNAQSDHAVMLRNMMAFYAKWITEGRQRPEVMHHWGHLIAEFVLRLKDRSTMVQEVKQRFSLSDRWLLFMRSGGSLRLYLCMKRIRAIFQG